MPAHRAVLHDLNIHGLDPSKPHGRIASNGRIAGHAAQEPKEEPKLALKKLPEKKVEEVVVAPPAPPVEEKKPDPVVEAAAAAEEKVAEEVTVVASSKKGKFGKKAAETTSTEPAPEAEKPADKPVS